MAKDQGSTGITKDKIFGPFIDPKEADASTETKWKTVFGELIDVIQFAIMTAFGEGIDAIYRYVYGIKNYLSNLSIAGLDTFSYVIMLWLASVRVDKYKQRHELFQDHNADKYYELESESLLAAMTVDEIAALALQKHPKGLTIPSWTRKEKLAYITLLLKHDAKALDPVPPHVQAKTKIAYAHLLFERVRKRELYVKNKYQDLINKLQLNPQEALLAHQEAPSAKSILYCKISKELNLTVEAAENLVAELTLIEKHWKSTNHLHEDEIDTKFISFMEAQWSIISQTPRSTARFDHEARLTHRMKELFKQHNIDATQKFEDLIGFYKTYHSDDLKHLHDQNDQNYYKAQERGILAYEQERTQTKIKVFGWVRQMSLIAVPLSAMIFIAVWINPVAALASFLPLFLVGSTSLVDEAVDIRYKFQKWRQSVAAMNAWKDQDKIPSTILDTIKKEIQARDAVPEALSQYSAQELIFLYSIAIKYQDQATHENHRSVTKYLPEDIAKAKDLFKHNDHEELVKTFIQKKSQPLATNSDIEAFIRSNKALILEFAKLAGESNEMLLTQGMHYLEFHCQLHDQYEKRAARRQTKFIQACFSFNGVFWGVLASMAVHILLLSASAVSAPVAMHAFTYIGFITIGIAGIASGIMIKYQLNQNKIKGEQKNEEHYLHMNHIVNPSIPTAPTASLIEGASKHVLMEISAKNLHVNTQSSLRFSNYYKLRPVPQPAQSNKNQSHAGLFSILFS